MHRTHYPLSILLVATLLQGCTGKSTTIFRLGAKAQPSGCAQVREVPWQDEAEEREWHTLPLLGGMPQGSADGDVKSHAQERQMGQEAQQAEGKSSRQQHMAMTTTAPADAVSQQQASSGPVSVPESDLKSLAHQIKKGNENVQDTSQVIVEEVEEVQSQLRVMDADNKAGVAAVQRGLDNVQRQGVAIDGKIADVAKGVKSVSDQLLNSPKKEDFQLLLHKMVSLEETVKKAIEPIKQQAAQAAQSERKEHAQTLTKLQQLRLQQVKGYLKAAKRSKQYGIEDFEKGLAMLHEAVILCRAGQHEYAIKNCKDVKSLFDSSLSHFETALGSAKKSKDGDMIQEIKGNIATVEKVSEELSAYVKELPLTTPRIQVVSSKSITQ